MLSMSWQNVQGLGGGGGAAPPPSSYNKIAQATVLNICYPAMGQSPNAVHTTFYTSLCRPVLLGPDVKQFEITIS